MHVISNEKDLLAVSGSANGPKGDELPKQIDSGGGMLPSDFCRGIGGSNDGPRAVASIPHDNYSYTGSQFAAGNGQTTSVNFTSFAGLGVTLAVEFVVQTLPNSAIVNDPSFRFKDGRMAP